MTTLDNAKQLTMLEVANRLNPRGELFTVAEIMTRENPILMDVPWLEANNFADNKTLVRASLPKGTWRAFNEGVEAQASTTRQETFPTGMLSALSRVDRDLIDMAPNPQTMRLQESKAFIEGLSQQLGEAFIYGDTKKNPKGFNGLAKYLGKVNGENVINAGGTGAAADKSSMYIVQWGDNKVFAHYPRCQGGKKGDFGIEHVSHGVQMVEDPDRKNYFAYVDEFKVACGLTVKDHRCVARIANIATDATEFNPDWIIDALAAMPNGGNGAIIYCSNLVLSKLYKAAKNSTAFNTGNILDVFGRPVTSVWGCPIHKVDSILNTETLVA